jgi:hypothetical protein
MYIVSRLMLGFGFLFCIISGSSLVGELGHPRERAALTAFFNASYFFGAILAAAISIGTVEIKGNWSWRLPSLLQIMPSLLQICTVLYVVFMLLPVNMILIMTYSLLPESPRYLISKGRDNEAHAILTKYHGEGDTNSELVNVEMAQIKTTIQIEMESSKQSWRSFFSQSGMRRRAFITAFIGGFTQLSGNTLLSYYSNILFQILGYTTPYAKSRINIANQVWSLVNASIIAVYVTRFKRRSMFLLSAVSMLLVFTAMTVSFAKVKEAKDAGTTNHAAAISALIWFFVYSPTYNIGNNSLTYSEWIEY